MSEAETARSLYFSLSDPSDPRYVSDVIYSLLGPGVGEGVGPHELFLRLSTPAYRRQALDLAIRAQATDPSNSLVRRVATIARLLTGLDLLTVDRAAVYRTVHQTIGLNEEQLAADPGNWTLRANVANNEAYLGELLSADGLEEGLVHLRRGADLMEASPAAIPMERRRLLEALLRLGRMEARARQFDSARVHLQRGLQLSQALWPDSREDLRSFAYIGMSYEALGDLERLGGHSNAACEAYRKSLETWRTWPTVGVSSFYDRENVAQLTSKLAPCQPAGR